MGMGCKLQWQAVLWLSLLAKIFLRPGEAVHPDAFPGWMGDSYRGKSEIQSRAYDLTTIPRSIPKPLMRGHHHDAPSSQAGSVVQLSWKPRAFLHKGLLSHAECDHLISLATPKLERSSVADSVHGNSVLSSIRTSHGMFLNKGQDEVVRTIEERIALWTFLPPENGESIQVLRYEPGQKYDAHYDYFSDPHNVQMGGHRYATVLMYLSDVEGGGETVFPNAPVDGGKGDDWSECGKQGLGVKPKKGDALLFFSMHPDATPDEYSLHTACPVLQGVKWSATKWIHVSSFDRPYRDPSKCEDGDPRCKEWASMGECSKNKAYMVGDAEYVGSCRKACRACDG